jgi:Zn-dependent M28 family amino/carboxypeptidase
MKSLWYILACAAFLGSLRGQSDTLALQQHVQKLVRGGGFRNHLNTRALDSAGAYIHRMLGKYADTVFYQPYRVGGKEYRNVVARFRGQTNKMVVVGAHYDVCEDQAGADDNASGVAGLLELARLLKNENRKYTTELVAYTLEEPPYFRSEQMGSYVHARSLHDRRAEVYGMISLEMIGFFKDNRGSQSYPIGLLKLFYGSRGNYITLVKKYGAGRFVRKFWKRMKHSRKIKTRKFAGPQALPGIDFSDHLNYWQFGYSALMITDTAFYRNKNYHETGDTPETLDFRRMGLVVDATLAALLAL